MKRKYDSPILKVYNYENIVMICTSIAGGEPGNGEVIPQSPEYEGPSTQFGSTLFDVYTTDE